MGWHGPGYAMAGWAWPIMGLFWIVVIVLIVLAIRGILPSVAPADRAVREGTSKEAFVILDERFARGEIDTAEYEERKRALKAKR